MTTVQPLDERNLDGYGAPIIPWRNVQRRLSQGWSQRPGSGGPNRHTCWLATVRADGRPHVAALGAQWVDGCFIFNAGAGTQKARNLAHDAHCVLTVALDEFDLVVEGSATRVTEDDRIAAVYRPPGWTVRDGGLYAEFSAPSAGPPPWNVYELTPTTVLAVGAVEPYGATRWRLRP
jgi:hypothetical protein